MVDHAATIQVRTSDGRIGPSPAARRFKKTRDNAVRRSRDAGRDELGQFAVAYDYFRAVVKAVALRGIDPHAATREATRRLWEVADLLAAQLIEQVGTGQ